MNAHVCNINTIAIEPVSPNILGRQILGEFFSLGFVNIRFASFNQLDRMIIKIVNGVYQQEHALELSTMQDKTTQPKYQLQDLILKDIRMNT